MPSDKYRLCWEAMHARLQLVFNYDGRARTVCPVILGYGAGGEEKIFVFQIGGSTRSNERLPSWKCLKLEKIKDLRTRAGAWLEGASHQQTQSCVKSVDLDVNIPKTLRHKAPLPFGSPKLMAPRIPETA